MGPSPAIYIRILESTGLNPNEFIETGGGCSGAGRIYTFLTYSDWSEPSNTCQFTNSYLRNSDHTTKGC